MNKNSDLYGFMLMLLLAAVLLPVSLTPAALASSNSGPGGGDDDDRHDDAPLVLSPADPSAVTTAIIIPLDAESHSGANPYSPNPATVSSGSTVTWTNIDDEDTHSATADDGSFSTGLLTPGSSGSAIISAPAGSTVPYHCDVHPEMRGILQVIAPAPGSAPASNASESPGPNSSMLQISDQPFAVGHYSTVSESLTNTMIELEIKGNTTITLPNSTEKITTNDTGNVTITFTETGGAILEGQVHLATADGTENATITVTEFFSSENAPGRGIASFSTNSTGRLAPLDRIVAVTLDEDQPDGSARVSFFEWHAGPLIDNQAAGNSTGNQTAPAPTANQTDIIDVSITPGSSSKTDDAFAPNPVQAAVGDTVRWTNDDSTPHTVTSGSAGQPDGNFDSSPNFNPLLALEQTFEHTFVESGEFPYYCALHPNMVGTVIVG